jgi:transposase
MTGRKDTQPHTGRPSKAEPFRAGLLGWLHKEPDVSSVELLRRAKLAGYDGAKSALYALVHDLRPSRQVPMLSFQPLPGEVTQHDFGQVAVRFSDGANRRIHFFATRLTFSRWAVVSIIPDERVETLIRVLVEHFSRLGGIPLLAVFDRAKVVARSDCRPGTIAEWEPAVAAMALDLGLGIDVCWRHRSGPNGASDSVAGWVKGTFFKRRRFVDEADLERQLSTWLGDVNATPSSRAKGAIPAERLVAERSRLRPLKTLPGALQRLPA